MVLARREGQVSIRGDTAWWTLLEREGVLVGRSDPDLDPGGYRALMLFELAERHHGVRGLAARLLSASPQRHVRPKSAELVALLQVGELDYAWMYESSARGARLAFDTLPPEIDLGREADSLAYARVSARVAGASRGDTIVVVGAPIRYGLSVPRRAAQPRVAERFLSYLLSDTGRRIMAREHLDVLPALHVVGTGAPGILAR
jgi:molybdate/tungstate transport system substrate-binding protein